MSMAWLDSQDWSLFVSSLATPSGGSLCPSPLTLCLALICTPSHWPPVGPGEDGRRKWSKVGAMSLSAPAAVKKCHGLGGLYKWTFASHSSGGWTAKIKASADPLSGEDPLPGSQHLLPVSSLEGRDRELSGLSSVRTLIPSWELHLLAPSPWGLGLNIWICGGTQTFGPWQDFILLRG